MLWEPTGCTCFSRRTGSLILGTWSLIWSLLLTVILAYGLLTVDADVIARDECDRNYSDMQDCEKLAGYAMVAIIATHMVLATLHVVFSSMLIHGVWKEMPCLMIPHMTMRLVSIIFSVIGGGIIILIFILIGVWRPLMVFTIVCGSWIFIETYFLLVMRAHYLDMKRSVSDIHQLLVEVPDMDDAPLKSKIFYP